MCICGLDFDWLVFFLPHQFLLFSLFLSTFLTIGTELLLLFVSPATPPAQQWPEFRAWPLPALSSPCTFCLQDSTAEGSVQPYPQVLGTAELPSPSRTHWLFIGHHLHLPCHPLRAPTDVHLISLVCILGFLWQKDGERFVPRDKT